MEFNKDSIIDRLKVLEDRMERGIPVAAATQVNATTGIEATVVPAKRVELPKAIPEDIKQVVSKWPAIVESVESGFMKTALKKGNLSLGTDDKLLLVMEDGDIAGNYFKGENAKSELETHISNYMQKQIQVEIKWLSGTQRFEDNFPDLKQIVGIDIEEFDDESEESDIF